MISNNLAGGLGNYLFQISSGYSLALNNNDEYLIDLNNVTQVHKNIDTYKNNIFRNLKFGTHNPSSFYQEPFFHFTEIPFSKNIKLSGYYQSEKYFINNREKILELFSVDKYSLETIKSKYNNIDFSVSCSVHIRRGDYLKYPSHHPQTNLSYFTEAINSTDNINYLIFSDDIEWCKENLTETNKNLIFIEGNADYVDLWMMSMCKNNIITNSTFSWWGAWLNNNPTKKVFVPKKWFGHMIKHNTKDLIPNTWIQI